MYRVLSTYSISNWIDIVFVVSPGIFHRVFLNFQCQGMLQTFAHKTCGQTPQSDNSPVPPPACAVQAENLAEIELGKKNMNSTFCWVKKGNCQLYSRIKLLYQVSASNPAYVGTS